MLSLAIKLHQHLSFQCSHFKSLCNVAVSRVFLPRSRASICPCIEAMPTFKFVMKQRQHFNRANIHICHKAASTFYLHWGHIYTSNMSKLWQHSSLPWNHVNTLLIPRPWQHSWSHVETSFAQKSCQHCIFAIEATSTLHSPKPWQHSWSHIEISFA